VGIADSSVRAWGDIFAAYDPTMVQWLVTLLALEFVTGVLLALKSNAFDWSRVFDIAKKSLWMGAAWGAAFVLSPTASAAVYALAVGASAAGVVNNIAAMAGTSIPGLAGQILQRGPGDGASSGVSGQTG
jgi:peptidoglycan/LPS O-acetylase OafA/YrhL